MLEQIELLTQTKRRLLLVLDMARGPETLYVARSWPGVSRAEVVHSPASATVAWLNAVLPVFAPYGPTLYVSGTPVADEPCRAAGGAVEYVPAWEGLWGWHGPCVMATVHPLSLASFCRGAWAQFILDRERLGRMIVVHFLSPHYPYIGEHAADTAKWTWDGRSPRIPGLAHALDQWEVPALLRQSVIDAYMGNLRLAWEAAWNLVQWLGRPAIVTADHGEAFHAQTDGVLLGHGFSAEYDTPEVREVPWIEVEPLPRNECIAARLEALGYA